MSVHRGRWWELEDDGRFRCDLCPRHCHLKPGQRAFCYVRRATADGIVLDTYGRSSGFCIDPIEKKTLNHFLPGSSVLSFGTAGCNLGCRFCQNWDISKAREHHRLTDTASPQRLAAVAVAEGCASVAFTYNDPVIFAEYAIDTAVACHEVGVKTVAVTAGYICGAPRRELYAHLDAANIDLKAFSERFYKKLCFAELGPVLETLRYVVHETDTWVELTTLLIPGENDSDAELHALTGWVVEELGPDVPIHFTAFHPDFKMTSNQRTPLPTVIRARTIAMENGVRYAYSGNVHHPATGSTWCHGCGDLVIERDWYSLGSYRLEEGRCVGCGTQVPGVFPGTSAGSWGRRRKRVHIGR